MFHDLDHIFRYHPPTPEQLAKYSHVRTMARMFAETILQTTPPGPDQDVAIRHVREATMTANAAIALRGRLETYATEGLAAANQTLADPGYDRVNEKLAAERGAVPRRG